MSSSDFETDAMRPTAARCDEDFLFVTLTDGRQIRVPLWWYPFLQDASPERRAETDLMYSGVRWPAMDEGVSIKALLLGWKAPDAKEPKQAA